MHTYIFSMPWMFQPRNSRDWLIIMLSSLLLSFSTATAYTPGWSHGHRGIDRVGGDFKTSHACNAASCCSTLCASTKGCEAWSFTPPSVCRLKSVVPPQSLAASAATASGVRRAAAKGLSPLKYAPVPLGSTKPAGWLRTQLIIMANGLSGHLNLFWDDVQDSVWVGGGHDHLGAGHERGPYWLNGVVPLAAHLNASGDTVASGALVVDVQAQVEQWIHFIIANQSKSGWLGPDDGFGGVGNTYWNGWNAAAAILQYADAQATSGGAVGAATAKRCNGAVLAYILECHRRMLTVPMSTWSQNRWQDWVYIVHWMMDQAPQGEEQALWDAAELAQQQSWDWDAYYRGTGIGTTGAYVGKSIPKFPKMNVPGWTMYDHGVNNAMGTKSCATWYRQSGKQSDADFAYTKLATQDKYHGQPHGMFSGDECYGGRALNRGIELCAVVEQMYSLQHNFRVLGDPAFIDRYERIAYNSLPATLDPTMWQHQYLQQANEINAMYQTNPHVWQTDGPDSTGFGVAPNFGCCTANFNQGWPKFASGLFFQKHDAAMKAAGGDAIVVAMLAPATHTTASGATVIVATAYPFGDNATIAVKASPTGAFNLYVRIPGWAVHATIALNNVDGKVGGAPIKAPNGTIYGPIAVKAGGTLTVVLELHPVIRVESTWGLEAKPLPTPVVYTSSHDRTATAPTADANVDFTYSIGASAAKSKVAGAMDVRSGSPGAVSYASVSHDVYGAGHDIVAASLDYRYLAGYTPQAGKAPKKASSFALVILDAANTSKTLATVCETGPLGNYSFDHGDAYSPVAQCGATGLKVPNAEAVVFALKFTNNERNLQVRLFAFVCSLSHSRARALSPSVCVCRPPCASCCYRRARSCT